MQQRVDGKPQVSPFAQATTVGHLQRTAGRSTPVIAQTTVSADLDVFHVDRFHLFLLKPVARIDFLLGAVLGCDLEGPVAQTDGTDHVLKPFTIRLTVR